MRANRSAGTRWGNRWSRHALPAESGSDGRPVVLAHRLRLRDGQVFVLAFDPSGEGFRGWACTIAWHLHGEHARRRDSQLVTDASPPQGATPCAMPGRSKDLEHAIARLPAAQRHALLLSALAGMSHGEIAEATGWPLGTVKSHLARGKSRLRELLEDYAHG